MTLALSLATDLDAETVVLRDGTVLVGTVLDMTSEFVIVATDAGEVVVAKSRIDRVEYNPGDSDPRMVVGGSPLVTVAGILAHELSVFAGASLALSPGFAIEGDVSVNRSVNSFAVSTGIGVQRLPDNRYLSGEYYGAIAHVRYVNAESQPAWAGQLMLKAGWRRTLGSRFLLGFGFGIGISVPAEELLQSTFLIDFGYVAIWHPAR